MWLLSAVLDSADVSLSIIVVSSYGQFYSRPLADTSKFQTVWFYYSLPFCQYIGDLDKGHKARNVF